MQEKEDYINIYLIIKYRLTYSINVNLVYRTSLATIKLRPQAQMRMQINFAQQGAVHTKMNLVNRTSLATIKLGPRTHGKGGAGNKTQKRKFR